MLIRSAGIIQPLSRPITEINRDSPQAHGLVGCWPAFSAFGGGNRVLYDLSGIGNHVPRTRNGLSTDPYYGRVYGDGTNHVGATRDDCPYPADVLTPTLVVRAKFSGGNSSARALIARNGQYGWQFRVDHPNQRLQYFHDMTGGDQLAYCEFPYEMGRWYHLAASVDGKLSSNVRLYIDGDEQVIVGVSNGGTRLSDAALPFQIMSNTYGFLAEARFYNRVLSAAEIADLYQNPFDLYRPRKRIVYSIPDAGGTPEPVASILEGLQATFPIIPHLSLTAPVASEITGLTAPLPLAARASLTVPVASEIGSLTATLPLVPRVALTVPEEEAAETLTGLSVVLPLFGRMSATVPVASTVTGLSAPLPLPPHFSATVPAASTLSLKSVLELAPELSLSAPVASTMALSTGLSLAPSLQMSVPIAGRLELLAALPLGARLSFAQGEIITPYTTIRLDRDYYQAITLLQDYHQSITLLQDYYQALGII